MRRFFGKKKKDNNELAEEEGGGLGLEVEVDGGEGAGEEEEEEEKKKKKKKEENMKRASSSSPVKKKVHEKKQKSGDDDEKEEEEELKDNRGGLSELGRKEKKKYNDDDDDDDSSSSSSSSDDDDDDDLEDLVDIEEDEDLFIDKEKEEREEIVRSNFDILTQVPFFAQFPNEHQVQLFNELRVEHYQDGDLIVQQGDKGDRMYVIIEGEAVVWREEKNGESRDITHLYSNDYFGELALVYGQHRNSNVSSIGNTTVMYLSKDGFEKFEKIRVFMIVQKIPLLSKLRQDMQIKIVRKLQPMIFERGDYVVKQGDVGDAFYMISKGSAVVEENKEVSTHLYEGHTFGQMALLSGAPRLASVRAKEQLICMMLKAKDFKELISEENEFNSLLTSDDQVIRRRRSKRDARKNKPRYYQAGSVDSTGRKYSAESGYSSAAMTAGRGSASSVFGTGAESWSTLAKARRGSVGSASLSSGGGNSNSASQLLVEGNKVDKTSRGGHKVINGFRLEKEIGRGTFGKVRLCIHEQTGTEYAIKIIDKSHIKKENMSVHVPGMEEMKQEVAIMKKLLHPNIVNLVAVIDDPAAQHLYIVTEYCENGAIMSGLENNQPLSEATARAYFRDLLLGLQYLHRQGVVHRDIKPMNLLLTKDNVVKIADFGAARMIVGGTKWISGVTGTPAFMAPELLVEDSDEYDGPAVDLWSCGATLFMLVTGSPPWMSDDEIKLSKKVKNDELLFPADWNKKNYSPHLKNLITKLLEKAPEKRLDLFATMTHDWVTEEGSEELLDLADPEHAESQGRLVHFESSGPATEDETNNAIEPIVIKQPATMPVAPSVAVLEASQSRKRSTVARKGSRRRSKMDIDRQLQGLGVVDVDDSEFLSEEEDDDDDDDDHDDDDAFDEEDDAYDITFIEGEKQMENSEYTANNQFDFQRMSRQPIQSSQNSNSFRIPNVVHGNAQVKKGGKKANWINARYAIHIDQNKRAKMEDTVVVIPKLSKGSSGPSFFTSKSSVALNNTLFAAVYDGHGGDLVSNILKDTLHGAIVAQPSYPKDLTMAVHNACLETDRKMLHKAANFIQDHQQKISAGTAKKSLVRTKGDRADEQTNLTVEYQKAGSTALIIMLSLKQSKRYVLCAWVGDSRAVLSRKGTALPLSSDHKPKTRPDETARIRKAGGTVNRKGQVDGTLAVSRSFGDINVKGHDIGALAAMKPVGVSPRDDEMLVNGIITPKPDIVEQEVDPDDEFIILASDGLWDVLSNQGAVNFVRQQLLLHSDIQLATVALVEKAALRSVDNISVIIISLN